MDVFDQMERMTSEELRAARTLIRDDQVNAPLEKQGDLSAMLDQVEAELVNRRGSRRAA